MELPSKDVRSPGDQQSDISKGPLYVPLPDASRYIRLLCIRDAMTEQLPVTFETAAYPVDDCPHYAAISYVWGNSAKRHRISINGRYMDINDNARDALNQACGYNRRFCQEDSIEQPIQYVWMDTICINQQDLDEKGFQVGMMADIYFGATVVYSCIGPREDGSETLLHVFDAIRDVYSYNFATRTPHQNLDTHYTGGFDSSIAVEWLLSQDEEYLSSICEAFARLAHRPYWSRMWIVQELCMGQNCLVLCGPDSFDLSDIRLLEGAFDDLLDAQLPVEWRFQIEAAWAFTSEGYMLRAIQPEIWTPDSFGSNITRMKDFKCYDPRDRVYALNAITKWGDGQPRLTPDYTKSAFEVVVEAVGHVRPTAKGFPESFGEMVRFGVLEALGIQAFQPQMRAAVANRRYHQPDQKAGLPSASMPLVRECSYAFARIARDSQGRLIVGFHQVKEDETPECTTLFRALAAVENGSSDVKDIFEKRWPLRLFSDTAVVGFVCNGAQEGDYLYPFDVPQAVASSASQIYIVLRCDDSDGRCAIIGQAIVFGHFEPDVRFPTWSEFEESGYTLVPCEPMFELALTAEDVVVLMGQDFVIQQSSAKARYPELVASKPIKTDTIERFQRLVTPVTTSAACGAQLVTHPSISQGLSALNIATKFATTSRSADIRQKEAFRISQTQTGFVFMESARAIRSFAGPFVFTPGDLCPIHGQGPTTMRLSENAIFERSAQPLKARYVECTCHRRG